MTSNSEASQNENAPNYVWDCMDCEFATTDEALAGKHQRESTPGVHVFHRRTLLYEATQSAAPVPQTAPTRDQRKKLDAFIESAAEKLCAELLVSHDYACTVENHCAELAEDAYRLAAGLPSEQEEGWVKVEDRLPERLTLVWSWNPLYPRAILSHLDSKGEWCGHFTDTPQCEMRGPLPTVDPKYWRRLPAPPERTK